MKENKIRGHGVSGTFRCVISLKPSELREDNHLPQDRTAGWLQSWNENPLVSLPRHSLTLHSKQPSPWILFCGSSRPFFLSKPSYAYLVTVGCSDPPGRSSQNSLDHSLCPMRSPTCCLSAISVTLSLAVRPSERTRT